MADERSLHPSSEPAKIIFVEVWKTKDDVLVLSNGEKVHPVAKESIIMHDPQVAGALVVGSGQFQLSVLIELQDKSLDTPAVEKKPEEFLLLIEEANAVAPSHAQIAADHIIIAAPV